MEIKANLVDVHKKQIYPAKIIFNEKIISIEKIDEKCTNYIIPGLIDAHIHIESSMLAPSRFAYAVIPNGTTSVVADPHEIANVLGIKGIDFMRKDAKNTPLKVFFTAPSCVPAASFETSGAVLDSEKINILLQEKDIVALGEMMNFPGVINKDLEVMKKINLAHKYSKPIDGHCPGLTGEDLKKYIKAGITTEHECTTLEEAQEKLNNGMKIMIRQGSSAKNMDALYPIAEQAPEKCFIVSDDMHADDLLKGHMNIKLKKLVSFGINPIDAVCMATINPAQHYSLDVGLLRKGDYADFVIVNNLQDFDAVETYIDGKLSAKDSKPLFNLEEIKHENSFDINEKTPEDFIIKSELKKGTASANIIKVVENQLITKRLCRNLEIKNHEVLPDLENDILKIAVAERYGNNRIGLGFITGFNIKNKTIASSVAHDSHNIVAVGADNKDIAKAVNTIKQMQGGLAIVKNNKVIAKLPLPIAGLMSTETANKVAQQLSTMHQNLKSNLNSPFMALSFMALPVIPELKITDRGLFDVKKFNFINLIEKENA